MKTYEVGSRPIFYPVDEVIVNKRNFAHLDLISHLQTLEDASTLCIDAIDLTALLTLKLIQQMNTALETLKGVLVDKHIVIFLLHSLDKSTLEAAGLHPAVVEEPDIDDEAFCRHVVEMVLRIGRIRKDKPEIDTYVKMLKKRLQEEHYRFPFDVVKEIITPPILTT